MTLMRRMKATQQRIGDFDMPTLKKYIALASHSVGYEAVIEASSEQEAFEIAREYIPSHSDFTWKKADEDGWLDLYCYDVYEDDGEDWQEESAK